MAPNRFAIFSGDGVTVNPELTPGTLVVNGLYHDVNLAYGVLPLFTDGSVLFVSSTALAEDNGNFFWDNTSKRLGLGSATPASRLHVAGKTATDIITTDMGLDINPVAPPGFITVGLAGAGPGLVDVGVHYYYVTYYTAFGETETSKNIAPFGAFVTTTAGDGQVDITLPISTDPRVTGRRIYRADTGSYYVNTFMVADIADNTTASYLDNISDAGRPGVVDAFYRENLTTTYLTIGGTATLLSSVRSLIVGIGAGAGFFAGTSTGGENVMLGPLAGENATTAVKNVLVGYYAGNGLTTGQDNVFIGHSTGSGYTDSTGSIAIGRNAGLGRQWYNTVVGYAAGSGGSSFYGVLIGRSAGASLTGSVHGNVMVGFYAGNNVTSGTYNVIMGCRVNAPVATGSGQLNIGNVLYGMDLYKNTGSSSSTPTVDGRIGIGLTTPTARLHLPAGTTVAGRAPLKLTAGPLLTTAEKGAIEFKDTTLYATTDGSRCSINLASDVLVADVVVANTTTETTILTFTAAANFLTVGKLLQIFALGHYTTRNASDTLTIRLKHGAVTLLTLTTPGKNVTAAALKFEASMTQQTVGAAGNTRQWMSFRGDGAPLISLAASAGTVDTMGAVTMTMTAQWSFADPANTLTIQQGWADTRN